MIMEKTEQSSFYCLMASSPLEVKQEIHFQILSLKSKSEEQSQFREIKTKSQIKQRNIIRFKLNPSSAKYFQDSPSTSNKEEIQIENNPNSNLNSNSNTVCPQCGKEFSSDKAMFGHLRIHEKKACKRIIKNPSSLKLKLKSKQQKTESNYPDLKWLVTEKRGRKPLVNTNSPEFLAASILLAMSKGETFECKNRKFDDLEKKFICETCNRSFPSHQALGGHRSSHKKEKGILVIPEMGELQNSEFQRAKVIKGDHVCEICGAVFGSGQALGGHKRLHYNKSVKRELVFHENRELVSHENPELISTEGLMRSFGISEVPVPVTRPEELWLF